MNTKESKMLKAKFCEETANDISDRLNLVLTAAEMMEIVETFEDMYLTEIYFG